MTTPANKSEITKQIQSETSIDHDIQKTSQAQLSKQRQEVLCCCMIV